VSGDRARDADRACERCLTRAWLLGRLAGHLERVRARIESVLALPDAELIAAVAGDSRDRVQHELEGLDRRRLRARAATQGLELLCRCDPGYPRRLRALRSAPAVLHVAGGLDRFLRACEEHPVAIVGARRPSAYGLETARALGRDLATAGLTVLSGMALGIDSAAHAGALAAGGATVAVLPGSADRPYPAARRSLHAEIRRTGAAVSELPPGASVWRWTFPARNRIIAALAALTVVVEAGERSGALLTARFAHAISRPVGAVPGRINSPLAHGPNELLASGAHVVRGPQDVLDILFGAGARAAPAHERPGVEPQLRALLAAIGDGDETAAALARAGLGAEAGLAALAALELSGHVRRVGAGRYALVG
jgi:DNA processing protein